ncbi:MAG: hypothetical protein B6I26_05870 [Desulfobacteraceae bacterium 4572_130]|nr:MAG: hypothetical protein B6I26_05870 [Desulfobacteraceae bacterium 4572_130]
MKIKRTILTKLEKALKNRKILILKGRRQVGKTTILKKLKQVLKNKKTAFFFADDLSQQDFFKNPEILMDYLILKYGFKKKERFFLFIDEFQHIKKAGLFLKNLYDKYDNLKIVVSGSSSLKITKNTEFLTGRHLSFNIQSISFLEFISYKEKKDFNSLNINNTKTIEKFYRVWEKNLEKYFMEYLRFGGYPEIICLQNIEEKKENLNQLLKTYIEKDIIELLNVGNVIVFKNLFKVLCTQTGSLINIKELSNLLSSSQDTIKKYMNILEETYLVKRISPFYTNSRKSIKKMQKIFVLDTGIVNLINRNIDDFTNIPNIGKEAENFVFNELYSTYNNDLYFYRTISGVEIDFVIDEKKITLLEVKYQNKVNFKKIKFKNFKIANPTTNVTKEIIITKNYLNLKKNKENLFIPIFLFPFLK